MKSNEKFITLPVRWALARGINCCQIKNKWKIFHNKNAKTLLSMLLTMLQGKRDEEELRLKRSEREIDQ